MLVAVDTGGTKTLVTSFDNDGTMGEVFKFPTPHKQTEYVRLLRSTLQEHYRKQEADALVIALPGIVKDGVALWCQNLGWKNFDAQKAFTDTLGSTPVFIENDANLAGLAEARALESTPSSVLYVTISTGIGTGIITDGHINPALRHSEGGRMLIEYDGIVREWEDFASGQSITKIYGEEAHNITSERTWNQIADRISRGFLAVIPLLQPDLVVIGGSIGTYFPQYAGRLTGMLREKLPPHIPCPQFFQAKHPESAVVYGCYYYVLDIPTSI